MLAFPLLWAARNLDSRVWLPIVIAMIGVGACQAAFGTHLSRAQLETLLTYVYSLGVFVPGGAACSPHHNRHSPGRVGTH